MSTVDNSYQARIDDVSDDDADESGGLDADVTYDLLSKRRRRDAVAVIQNEGPMDVGELAEFVAAREHTTTPADVTPEQRKRVYISLHQCHLPKFDEHGVLIYDRDTGRVSCGPNVGTVGWYLENGPAKESRSVFRKLSELLTR